MRAGQRASIKIDWKPDGDVSYCGLRTATPRTSQQQNQMSIWSEMARDMDYYLIAGNNLDSVVSGYRQLTGKAQVFPKWSFGFWQSRERYKTSNEIESTSERSAKSISQWTISYRIGTTGSSIRGAHTNSNRYVIPIRRPCSTVCMQ